MKRIRDTKLSVKLITIGMVTVLIPMFIIGLISVRTSSKALLESGRIATFQVAKNLSQTSSLFIAQEIKFARSMALSPEVITTSLAIAGNGASGAEDEIAMLNGHFKTYMGRIGEDYDLFFLTDAAGNILADSMAGSLRKKKVNVKDRGYFKAAQTGETVVGEPIMSRASGKAVITISVPMYDEAKGFAGVFTSVIRLDTLSSKLTTVKIGETGYAYLVNNKGMVIAHPNNDYLFKLNVLEVEGMEEVGRLMTANESGVRNYLFKGVEKVAGFAHVPETGWSVGVTVDHGELMAPVRKMTYYSLITGLVTLVVVGAFIFFGAMSIVSPINRTVSGLKDISQGDGDLTKRLEVSGRDEVGILSHRFNEFVAKLHTMISDITQGVETLSHASGNLADISKEMSTGAGQTTEKAGAVATATGEMTNHMNSVSAAMVQSSDNINTVAGAAEEMNATIGEIARHAEEARGISAAAVDQVETSREKMGELGNAAQAIGQVVQTITDISEQVNLLSLNATIEAARAGEAGRGFAVVANEIKELANQTSNASMDIKEKIDHIQDSSSATLDGMLEISKVIGDVNDIVSTIAAAVEEQSSAVNEIAENISQVSTGLKEVTQTVNDSSNSAQVISVDITEVDQASQTMADRSRLVLKSSGELSHLAEQLDEMVGRFKI
ncbi:MAG: methyl-accepting chemotaxis protein [Desulfobacterales bacterium]|nr:methyl-accepting chemotaxis protein [Desulfobacterales bacterium]